MINLTRILLLLISTVATKCWQGRIHKGSFQEKKMIERNVYGLILFLGIYGFYDDREEQKRKKKAEASASVCLFGPGWS